MSKAGYLLPPVIRPAVEPGSMPVSEKSQNKSLQHLETRIDAYLCEDENGFYRRARPASLVELAEQHASLAWQAATELGPAELDDRDLPWSDALAPNAVFILGTHRSGTTLVRELLDGHPALSVLPSEGNLLTSFEAPLRRLDASVRAGALARIWIARLVLSEGVPPYWLLGRSVEAGSPYVDFARHVMSWIQSPCVRNISAPYDAFLSVILAYTVCTRSPDERVGIRAWVEKTPMHELKIKKSMRRFADAYCVHVVRDPRAILYSRRTLEASVDGHPEEFVRFTKDIARSLDAATRNQKRFGPEKYHVLHYEDLISDTGNTLTGLRDFLGLDDHVVLQCPTVTGRPTRPNSAHEMPNEGQAILTSSLEAFRSHLTDQEQAALQRYAAKPAAAHGYDLDR